MKNLIASACALFFLSMSATAQTSTEERLSTLESKVTQLSDKIQDLNLRVDEVLLQNQHLRAALDFGKPITSQVGESGVEYHLLSLTGDSTSGMVTAKFQIVSKRPSCSVSFNIFNYPSMIDIQGNRYSTSTYEIGGEHALTIYKDVPVKASVTFKDIDSSTTNEIKLLLMNITCQVDTFDNDILQFRDLHIDWK